MPFSTIYDSGGRHFCLHIDIKCSDANRKKFRVWAEEQGKKNSKYADREVIVDGGSRRIFLSLPISPNQLFIGVVNTAEPLDNSFEVVLMEAPLRTYNIETSAQTDKFIAMAENFCRRCGYNDASESGRPFSDSDKEFVIKYFDVITDRGSKAPINTPARIGNQTGIIEVAKNKFDRYTVPMRMIILLHEYSHKFRNPKIGLPVSSEKGADINALYVYLGRGYSKVDALLVFCKVFYGAQSKSNLERLRLIYDYMKRYEQGEFAERLT